MSVTESLMQVTTGIEGVRKRAGQYLLDTGTYHALKLRYWIGLLGIGTQVPYCVAILLAMIFTSGGPTGLIPNSLAYWFYIGGNMVLTVALFAFVALMFVGYRDDKGHYHYATSRWVAAFYFFVVLVAGIWFAFCGGWFIGTVIFCGVSPGSINDCIPGNFWIFFTNIFIVCGMVPLFLIAVVHAFGLFFATKELHHVGVVLGTDAASAIAYLRYDARDKTRTWTEIDKFDNKFLEKLCGESTSHGHSNANTGSNVLSTPYSTVGDEND